MEEYIFVYEKKERRENFIERFDVIHHFCCLGELTEEESHDLCARIKTWAIQNGFIDRGHFDIPRDDLRSDFSWARLSRVGVLSKQNFLKRKDYDSPALLRMDEELQRRRNSSIELTSDNPYYLLNEALEYANALRRSRTDNLPSEAMPSSGNMEDKADQPDPLVKKDEIRKKNIELILGTLVHLYMKVVQSDAGQTEEARKEQAIQAVKDLHGLGERFSDYSFEPINTIDEYTNLEKREEKVEKRRSSSKETTILKAGVIFFQYCPDVPRKTAKEHKRAFGETAYNNATKVKKTLGLPANEI